MVIYDSVLFAIVALLCVRDDSGRPALGRANCRGLRRYGSRITHTRLTVIATVVLMSAVLVPIAVFSLLRIGGDPKPAYDIWPYPPVKVYDPYGDLERAGKPGTLEVAVRVVDLTGRIGPHVVCGLGIPGDTQQAEHRDRPCRRPSAPAVATTVIRTVSEFPRRPLADRCHRGDARNRATTANSITM